MKSLSSLSFALCFAACVTAPDSNPPQPNDEVALAQEGESAPGSDPQANDPQATATEDPDALEANFLREMGVEPEPEPEPVVQNAEEVAEVIEEVQAAVAQPVVNEGVAYPAEPPQLSVWNDPAAQRRFEESYFAESETTPEISDEERAVLIEVRDLLGEDKSDKAIALLKKESNDESTAIFDYFQANIHVQNGRPEEAIEAYRIAVNRFPRYRQAWNNLGRLYVQNGRFAEAGEAFTKVIEQGGGSGEMFGLLGYSRSKLSDPLAAETAYRMAVLMDPGNTDWKIGLARSLFEQRQYAACIAMCDTLIEATPERHELWLMQGEAYSRSGQGVEAAKNFEMVDRLGHANAGSLNSIADIYAREGLYDLAARSFMRALAHDPKVSEARALRGAQYLMGQGAYEWAEEIVGAMESYEEEHFSKKTRKDMLRLRAALAVELGDPNAEIAVLEKSLELDPTDGRTLIQIGEYKHRQNDLESAIFYFERASKLEGFEGEALIAHGQALVREGRYQEAVPLLKQGQKLKPSDRLATYLETVQRMAKRGS